MKKCKKCIDFLADYLDGELPEAQRKEFEHHLNLCPPCKDYVCSYKQTIRAVHQCMCEHPDKPEEECSEPPEMPEQLVQAILKSTRKSDS